MTADAQLDRTTADNHFRLGLLFAVSSALTFGSSGPFAKALMEAGWSPTAAVTARLAGGAVMMAAFAGVVRPGWVREVLGHAKTVVGYGLIPIAGAQLCYYNAVAHLSVGVALLLEYTAPILVVGWVWATTRRRPSAMTFGGVALAIVGIVLVLDVFSGAHINLIGVSWGLAAAVCAACYFMMSNQASTDGDGLSPISLATGGLIVGTAAVALLGVTGVMPLTFTTNPVTLAGHTTAWLVPVIALGLIPTALAYTLGIVGIARLKPRFASLVGLSEVLFAVLIAWVMLGEAMSVSQAIGGAVVLVGLAVARQGDRSEQASPREATQIELATWPDLALQEKTERAND
ncbi:MULTISPECIES: EamA family transporter [Mycolicibacterium]|uniref:Integral membrane protein n=1 Tax=Mycolicibacterium senegalense TaxID=1796 RepID=A0A378W4Q5_9MYCO|nr:MULTISPECIES: EamA family transporter [Mycolicibacterium]MCV7335800.1 EamA family transporter [Mycolicibacterium senegalense]MDR7288864.1 drug/metabolite transporter (DMT)-like permease [Mycolicibacterium senegalense]QZA25766.1 EamA family transporter [Mycolicibacterium senegalense]CDP84929.1 integral membrane protein [Mycolicibacterium farcinogenes]SUA27564.1 integral membrane protein [Mycolicibacterium senegalense]